MPRIYTYENLTGQVFGRLTVIALHHTMPRSKRFWTCRCSCGQDHIVEGGSLKYGSVQSCGCLSREVAAKTGAATGHLRRKCRTVKVGQRFGKLVALEYLSGSRNDGNRQEWMCQCDCGNKKGFRAYDLSHGVIVSCGCTWKERVRQAAIKANTTHGLSNNLAYPSWKAMMNRCTNPEAFGYSDYGGRGITVCEAIKKTPQAILDLIGERPSEGYDMDRIDNNGNYSCGQCDQCRSMGWTTNIRWATHKENLRNRRNNVLFSIDGTIRCASDWAERFGLKRTQFLYRYRKNKLIVQAD